MKDKTDYEEAKLSIIRFDAGDIVTASAESVAPPLGGEKDDWQPNTDSGGWL